MTPRSVLGCRETNARKFPEPKQPVPINWPTGTKEDWSDKRYVTDTLTPYNWIFIQKVTLEDAGGTETVNIPRMCLHCDNPSCANLCPSRMVAQVTQRHQQPPGAMLVDGEFAKTEDIEAVSPRTPV